MRCGSIFSGCGGWEVGARAFGLKPVFGVELDAWRAQVHEANFPNTGLINDNVLEVDTRVLPKVDVLFASPPCQESSPARRAHALARRHDADVGMVILPFVDGCRPDVVLIENTPNYRNEPVLPEIVEGLISRGFVLDERVIWTDRLGMATRRARLIIRAVRNGYRIRDIPERAPLGWAGEVADLLDPTARPYPLAPWQAAALSQLPPNGYPALIVGGNPSYRQVGGEKVRKVWYGPREPAPTLVPGSATNKSMSGHRVLIDPHTPVRFTAAMAARLQGFPDSYLWPDDDNLAMVLIGNSVPPPLSAAVLKSVL